jgi:hypothetical protein
MRASVTIKLIEIFGMLFARNGYALYRSTVVPVLHLVFTTVTTQLARLKICCGLVECHSVIDTTRTFINYNG